MAKVIIRQLDIVYKNVEKEIHRTAKSGGMFAGALSSEGYAGGYKDAISDVISALNGNKPKRRSYWEAC